MCARIIVDEDGEPLEVTTADALDRVLLLASEEARLRGMLNVIHIESANGNTLWVVVGGDETILGFISSHGNPPYYESRGPLPEDLPVLTGYVSFKHHTEFPRRCVIPMELGLRAAREFVATGSRPDCVSWAET